MKLALYLAALISWILAGFIYFEKWTFNGASLLMWLLLCISFICISALMYFKKER